MKLIKVEVFTATTYCPNHHSKNSCAYLVSILNLQCSLFNVICYCPILFFHEIHNCTIQPVSLKYLLHQFLSPSKNPNSIHTHSKFQVKDFASHYIWGYFLWLSIIWLENKLYIIPQISFVTRVLHAQTPVKAVVRCLIGGELFTILVYTLHKIILFILHNFACSHTQFLKKKKKKRTWSNLAAHPSHDSGGGGGRWLQD